MDLIIKIAGVAFLIYLVWFFLQPKPVFIIKISPKGSSVPVGKVSQWFVDEVKSLCEEQQINTGTIKAINRNNRISLVFSHHFPKHMHQRIRNVWNLPK